MPTETPKQIGAMLEAEQRWKQDECEHAKARKTARLWVIPAAQQSIAQKGFRLLAKLLK